MSTERSLASRTWPLLGSGAGRVSPRGPDEEMSAQGGGRRTRASAHGRHAAQAHEPQDALGFPACFTALGSSQILVMVAAGAGAARLLVLLLIAAAAPSRARGSGCRVGSAARGVSAGGRGGAASCRL